MRCASIHRRAVPGNEVHRDGLFWMPLLARTMGVRENEVCDALVGGVKPEETNEGPVWYLEIIDGKDSGSERNVPSAELVLGMGFLERRAIGRNPERVKPARKLGLAQRALWLEERPHLEDDLVRLVVLGREAHQGARALNSRFEIRRPLAARLRIDEIVHCDGPRGFEKRLYFTEEGFREAIERIGTSPPRLEKALENAALLRHHGHSLAADRGEAADRVPERDQPAREAAELIESAQHAAGHPEPSDVADALRAADRILDRRQAERLGECHERIDVTGRRFAVVYAKRDAPSSPLGGQEDPEAVAAGGDGACTTPSQSVGASPGFSKTAVA
jgi:hypothetical protein